MRIFLGLLLLPALATVALGGPAGAATLTVNTLGDAGDDNAGNGVCATGAVVFIGGLPASECTLRAALEEATALAGADLIHFHASLPRTNGFSRFTPASPYPNVMGVVTKAIVIEPPSRVVVAGHLLATATDVRQLVGNDVDGGNTSEFGNAVLLPEPGFAAGLVSGLLGLVWLDRRARARAIRGETA